SGGGVVLPLSLSPQPTTVPSAFNASPKSKPTAMATTLERPGGGVDGAGFPQPTTVPSFFKARLNSYPAAMAATSVRLVGGVASPSELSPKAVTVPSFFNSNTWL